MILAVGEKVHVQYRRRFGDDERRHFVGEVEWYSDTIARLRGFGFLYDTSRGEFVRRSAERTRLVPLTTGEIVSLLPADAVVANARYERDEDGALVVTDGETFTLEVAEPGTRR